MGHSGPVASFIGHAVQQGRLKVTADRRTLLVDLAVYLFAYNSFHGYAPGLQASGSFHLHPEVIDLFCEMIRDTVGRAEFCFCPVK